MIDIFIVTGKSGAGKDSLVNAFMMQISYGLITNPYIEKLVPYTTRDPRNYNERYYKIYNFVGDEELDKLISNEKVFSEVRTYYIEDPKKAGVKKKVRYATIIDIENLKENSISIMNGQYETFESLCKYVVENNCNLGIAYDGDGDRCLTVDEKGNEIHYKDSNGYEYWKEYDENHNEIHYKTSDGYERWQEYDENGNEIHYKDSNGFEVWE